MALSVESLWLEELIPLRSLARGRQRQRRDILMVRSQFCIGMRILRGCMIEGSIIMSGIVIKSRSQRDGNIMQGSASIPNPKD